MSCIKPVLIISLTGVLGFLVTGSGEDQVQGNYGILDQVHAIKWVKDNIEAFGGDPEKVTLAGQSAGGQSVFIHMASQTTSQYFRSVIVECPVLTVSFKDLIETAKSGNDVALKLNCLRPDGQVSIECLRKKHVTKILEAQQKIGKAMSTLINDAERWKPALDNSAVSGQIFDTVQDEMSQPASRKPMIFNYVQEEGYLFVMAKYSKPIGPSDLEGIIYLNFGFSCGYNVKSLYPVASDDAREALSYLITDLIFRCPIGTMSRYISQTWSDGDVWTYVWHYPIDSGLPEEFSMYYQRVCNGTEIPYVFGSLASIGITPSKRNRKLSEAMMDYYSNFVHHGDPNVVRPTSGQASSHSTLLPPDNIMSSYAFWPRISSGSTKGSVRELVITQEGGFKDREILEPDERCKYWDDKGYPVS